jgi:pyridine nucleotide-disulfide oxidoreductase domain-containing protein 1
LYYQQSVEDKEVRRDLEVWTRITPNEEYVKLIVHHGRVIGALLIGDTDLEEVCENLILNELDVRRYGMDLLDPDIDIEDYFD